MDRVVGPDGINLARRHDVRVDPTQLWLFGFKSASKSVLMERIHRVSEVNTLKSRVPAVGSRLIAAYTCT